MVGSAVDGLMYLYYNTASCYGWFCCWWTMYLPVTMVGSVLMNCCYRWISWWNRINYKSILSPFPEKIKLAPSFSRKNKTRLLWAQRRSGSHTNSSSTWKDSRPLLCLSTTFALRSVKLSGAKDFEKKGKGEEGNNNKNMATLREVGGMHCLKLIKAVFPRLINN